MKGLIPCLASVLIGILLLTHSLVGCTSKKRAKHYGGTTKIELASNRKVVNAGWKKDNLWILTRHMRANEKPETFEFKEDSSWGIFEGTIIIIEKKSF